MIALALALILSQDGTCKVGATCRAYGLQPPGIASASLPTCNSTVRGRIMQCTNCNTGSTPCMTYCNGSAWSCVATAASTSDTCTGTNCNIGGGGIVTDGGVTAAGDIASRSSLYARETAGGSQCVRLVVSGDNHYFDNCSGTMFVCSAATGVCVFAYAISANTSLSAGSFVQATTYLRSVGVATGSLPTCNGALAGAVIFDTTAAKLKVCSGAAWETITSV